MTIPSAPIRDTITRRRRRENSGHQTFASSMGRNGAASHMVNPATVDKCLVAVGDYTQGARNTHADQYGSIQKAPSSPVRAAARRGATTGYGRRATRTV